MELRHRDFRGKIHVFPVHCPQPSKAATLMQSKAGQMVRKTLQRVRHYFPAVFAPVVFRLMNWTISTLLLYILHRCPSLASLSLLCCFSSPTLSLSPLSTFYLPFFIS